MAKETKLVALKTTRVFTPYRKGEVFGLPEDEAKQVVEESKGAVKYYKAPKSSKSSDDGDSADDSKAKKSK